MLAKTVIWYNSPFDNAEITGREISDKKTTYSSECGGPTFSVTFHF